MPEGGCLLIVVVARKIVWFDLKFVFIVLFCYEMATRRLCQIITHSFLFLSAYLYVISSTKLTKCAAKQRGKEKDEGLKQLK